MVGEKERARLGGVYALRKTPRVLHCQPSCSVFDTGVVEATFGYSGVSHAFIMTCHKRSRSLVVWLRETQVNLWMLSLKIGQVFGQLHF